MRGVAGRGREARGLRAHAELGAQRAQSGELREGIIKLPAAFALGPAQPELVVAGHPEDLFVRAREEGHRPAEDSDVVRDVAGDDERVAAVAARGRVRLHPRHVRGIISVQVGDDEKLHRGEGGRDWVVFLSREGLGCVSGAAAAAPGRRGAARAAARRGGLGALRPMQRLIKKLSEGM